MTRLRGIDLSVWQGGNVDWPVLAKHTDFVLIRSTHGDAPKIGLAVDNYYSRNIAGARAQRMRRGTYHFPGAHDPIVEADYYAFHTARRDGELQMLDFEGPVLNLPRADRVPWALKFLDRTFYRTGNRPLIYMSESVEHDLDWTSVVRRNYGLVSAKWGSREPAPKHWPFWAVWQDTDRLPTPGITVQAPDGDWFNGTGTQWDAYGRNTGTQSTPPPKPASEWPKEYTTKAGDSLWSIAAKFYGDGSKYTLIASANRIKNANVIGVGVKLTIPTPFSGSQSMKG